MFGYKIQYRRSDSNRHRYLFLRQTPLPIWALRHFSKEGLAPSNLVYRSHLYLLYLISNNPLRPVECPIQDSNLQNLVSKTSMYTNSINRAGSQGRGRTSKQLVQSEVTLPICLLGNKYGNTPLNN